MSFLPTDTILARLQSELIAEFERLLNGEADLDGERLLEGTSWRIVAREPCVEVFVTVWESSVIVDVCRDDMTPGSISVQREELESVTLDSVVTRIVTTVSGMIGCLRG